MNSQQSINWKNTKGKYISNFRDEGRNRKTKEYALWCDMRTRCSNEKEHIRNPYTKDCTASDLFLDYQSFAEWCNNQKGFGLEGYELDKDLLIEGNKHYSENSCAFIPYWLNGFLTKSDKTRGKYKIGVYFEKSSGKYKAQISKYDPISKVIKKVSIGRFDSEEDAYLAYKKQKESIAKYYAEILKLNYEVDNRVIERLKTFSL